MQHPIIPDNVRRTFYDAGMQQAALDSVFGHNQKETRPTATREDANGGGAFWLFALIGLIIAAVLSAFGAGDAATPRNGDRP